MTVVTEVENSTVLNSTGTTPMPIAGPTFYLNEICPPINMIRYVNYYMICSPSYMLYIYTCTTQITCSNNPNQILVVRNLVLYLLT